MNAGLVTIASRNKSSFKINTQGGGNALYAIPSADVRSKIYWFIKFTRCISKDKPNGSKSFEKGEKIPSNSHSAQQRDKATKESQPQENKNKPSQQANEKI